MTPPLLEATGLAKGFGGLRVFHDVSFDVDAGSIVGLIGPNGAGKSTLLNCISGFLRPDAGSIHIDGEPIGRRPPDALCRRGVTRTFQHPRLLGHYTSLENVLVGAHTQGRPRWAVAPWRSVGASAEERRLTAIARSCLERLSCEHLAGVPAEALTAGQQRLVSVARALASSPRLLLLDEPAAGLNAVETGRLGASLGALAEEGVAMLLVEHDLSLVMRTCDEIVVVAQGTVIARGEPDRIRRDPHVIEAYLGSGRATDGVGGRDG